MRKIPLIISLLLLGALLSFALFAPVNADTPIKEAAPAPQTDSEEVEKAPPLPNQAGIEAVSTGYAWSQTTTTYTEITGGTIHGTASNDDGSFNAVPLGFTFTYDGVDYTQVSIQSNGFIAMGASVSNTYTPLSTGTTNNVLAILGRDLQGNGTTSELMSKLEGDAPNRVFTIQWKQYKRWGSSYVGDDFNFQIKLYETSNLVQYVYGPFTLVAGTTTAQVGLRGAANSDFQNRTTGPTGWTDTLPGTLNSSSMSLTNLVYPPDGLTWNWSVVFAPNLNPSTKAATPAVVRTGEVIDYQIVIRNTGDDTATAANMSDPIPTGATYVPGSLATDGSPAATYDMGTNAIQWGAADLATGEAVTVTFQVTATAVSGVNIVNTATISATNAAAAVVRTATTPVVGCTDDPFYACADSLTPGGPAFTWYSAISGTLILDAGAVGDDREVNVTLPFPFTFYGATSTDIRVGDNGAILFNATTGEVGFSNVAMASAPANFIAPFWDDMDTDTGGTYTDVFGVEPNRIFVVEWHQRPHFSNVGAATFQVLFFESTNDLVFQYQDVDFGNAAYNNGASATVGIKGSTIQYSFNAPALSDGLAIQFTPIPQVSINLNKTVGTESGVCATTSEITVAEGTTVYYCYEVENTGDVTLNLHDLEDDQLGAIFTGLNYALDPGASIDTVAAGLSISAVITTTTVNTATWTAYNAGPTDVVTMVDTATVTVPDSAFLRVAHLAPFAMDPGTAVTVTLNGTPALTDFAYGDSTTYIQLPVGTYDVEVSPAGSSTPAITATLTLNLETYYTAVAYGDGVNQDLGLLALVDDNTAPAAGNFHLRLGHLAPFAAGSATADIRLQDGTPVITDVNFGDVTGYIPLPVGTYDLKITTPGGGTTLIDPAPVTFAEGDIVTAFAAGEGSNQDLGVFAYPVDVEGFFLRLAVAEITLDKTVGTDSSVCATTDAINVIAGTDVTYCYTVENTGDLELNLHDLEDSELGTIFSGLSYALAPGASVFVTETVTINATTVNTATWTAYNTGPIDVASASDTATVTVVTPSNGLPLEDFNAGTAGFPPAGWSVINNGGTCVWESTETTGYANLTGGDGFAAEANSDDCGSGTTMNTELRTPFFNLTGATSPVLVYRYDYRDLGVADQGTVDISTDGGATWINLETYLVSDRGPKQNVVDLSAYIGEPLLQLRFTYFAPGWDWWFQIDDVEVLLEAIPQIDVTPTSLASSQLPNTTRTENLNIANTGSGDLTWDIVEAPAACATPGDIPWLSVTPTSGVTAVGEDDDVTVTFDSTGLAPGSYNGLLCVESDDPSTPVVAVSVDLTVETQPTIVIDPTAVSATLDFGTQGTAPITITNAGTGDLIWNIDEAPTALTPAAVLYDNGPLVTHPGGGAGGADESRLQNSTLLMTTLGFGNQFAVGNRMADDFTVPPGGWTLDSVTFFAYQTGSTTASTITGVYVQIWDGPPNDPASTIVFGDLTTNRMTSTTWSNIYRTSETSIGNTTRPIMANVADLGGLSLPAGTYWFDWTTNGSLTSGPWAPPVTIIGQTTTGNALQFTGTWGPANDGGTLTQQDLPFVIEGSSDSVCATPEDIPWLSVSPDSGSTAAGASSNIAVSLDSDGLAPGDYGATLCVYSSDPVQPLVEVPVSLTVEASSWLRVAHLAPFAMDPGTAVTVTLNGVAALTDFAYGDSTTYIELPSGTYDIEVIPAGSSTAAITGTVILDPNMYYTAVAYGDGLNQDLGLLALADDNTTPAAGFFHIRLGHLAPFAAGSALADIRLQDGTPVLTDVMFSDVTGYIPLLAGTYDLKITTPGGGTTLIDPAPATFAEGALVTAFATGEGVNQDLGVFGWLVDELGFFLPLADYSLALDPLTAALSGAPGETVTYTLRITNTGNIANSYSIVASGNDWDVTVVSNVSLLAGEGVDVTVVVAVPVTALDGEDDVLVITVTSDNDASATASATLTTTAVVEGFTLYLPIVIKP